MYIFYPVRLVNTACVFDVRFTTQYAVPCFCMQDGGGDGTDDHGAVLKLRYSMASGARFYRAGGTMYDR